MSQDPSNIPIAQVNISPCIMLDAIVELSREVVSLGPYDEQEAERKLSKLQELLRAFHGNPEESLLGRKIAKSIDGEVQDLQRPSYVRRRKRAWATIIVEWAKQCGHSQQ